MEKEIKEGFKILKIEEENYPDYKNPYEFTRQIKICSVLNEKDVFYDSSAEMPIKPKK